MAIYQANADFNYAGVWYRKGSVVEDDAHVYALFPSRFTAVAPTGAAQEITGATAQLQIDSIVTALVALGLATDGR